MSANTLILDAPKGDGGKKYSTFVWLGEPGYAQYEEVHYAGQPNTKKTSAMVDSMLISAINYPGALLALCRDTKANLMDSTKRTVDTRFSSAISAGVCSYVSSRNSYEFVNGSTIRLFGLDVPDAEDALLGMEPFRAFLDQAEGIREDLVDTLLTRLARQRPLHKDTGKPGMAFIKSTANFQKGRGWLWQRCETDATEIEPDFIERTFIGEQFGKQYTAKRLLIKVRTEEFDLGEDDQYGSMILLAGGSSNKFFSNDWNENHGILFPEYNPNLHEVTSADNLENSIGYGGLDHGLGGTSHPSVLEVGALTVEGQLVICGEYVSQSVQSAKQSAIAMSAQLSRLNDMGVREFYLWGDSSMWRRDPRNPDECVAQDYEEVFDKLPFKVYLEPASKKKDSAQDLVKGLEGLTGLNRMKELLLGRIENGKRAKVVIHKKCHGLINMFSNVTIENIIKDQVPFTDIFDATRYFMSRVPFESIRNINPDSEDRYSKQEKRSIRRTVRYRLGG